jgi:hypothetical protein
MTKIRMVTALWGDWHIDALLDVNFRTLLAPGNLPHFSLQHDVTYHIHTRATDKARIEASPIAGEIGKLLDLKIFGSLPEEGAGDTPGAQHAIWTKAADEARRDGAYIMNMPPDVAFADGSLAALDRPLSAGKKSINWAYSRAVAETFAPALKERFGDSSDPIILLGRELVELNLRHLHPLSMACFADSPYFVRHPELILWPVAGEGLLLRVLATVNHLFDPGYFELNQNHLIAGRTDGQPLDMADVFHFDDSDEFFVVSLAEMGKDFSWFDSDRTAHPAVIGRWWLQFDSPTNDHFVAHQIRWHVNAPTTSAWRRRERAANLFLSRAAAAREAMRIRWTVEGIQTVDCVIASSIIALAIETGAILRSFPRPGRAVVFLPIDEVLEAFDSTSLNDLLVGEGGRNLVRFLRRHVAFVEDDQDVNLDTGGRHCFTTVDGREVIVEIHEGGPTVDGIPIVAGPIETGRHTIFVIKGVLDDEFGEMIASEEDETYHLAGGQS